MSRWRLLYDGDFVTLRLLMRFNALNGKQPAIFFRMRTLGLYVPLALLGARLFALDGVFWSAFIANVSAGLLAFLWLFHTTRKEEKTLAGQRQDA
ncbi:MAG: hypothetical protein U5N26_03175 [Candidatus Marinimicrobia bacterium]|nr:hypothetical protein [Candidatus Neomarinimicrobiota bacterium]